MILSYIVKETTHLRDEVKESLEINSSQTKDSFKSLLGVLSEIRNLQEEIEDVKKEVVNLSTLLSPSKVKQNSSYIRKIKPLSNSTLDIQPGSCIKIGQFRWLVIDVNTVGEIRILCEEIAAITKYALRDQIIESTIQSTFSQKEISEYKIKDLKMPSKNDIDKATKLNMAHTDSFWLLGGIIYNNNGYIRRDEWEEHGFRPILTIESHLITSKV